MQPELEKKSGSYRVLARTYRPNKFSEMIGQEALVRTLSNAMRTGRIAHAFLLTGIRGVGKTTTARIIARALNCIGEDGQGEPTPEPCGVCEHCRAIADGRHIDILEMDAATHTGIDDIREIVDSVRYAPTSARYKVYIIDEVHMLSEKAFNGLLKTLEEPPPQTLFIFATTEVRKVPITVLSRCQRFDLRRIEAEVLARYFKKICERESVDIEDSALALISRAAEGSARDGLSLLDQAIALSGGGQIGIDQVQDMLGLADRKRVLDLFEQTMRGSISDALRSLGDLYERGAEPEAVVQDLLEISHWLTRLKVAGGKEGDPSANGWDAERGRAMSGELSMAVLSSAWQMLLKGLDDLRIAPSPLLAAEMLLIRLAHAADLPSAETMLAILQSEGGGGPPPGGLGAGGSLGGVASSSSSGSKAASPTPSGGTDVAASAQATPASSHDQMADAQPAKPEANGLKATPPSMANGKGPDAATAPSKSDTADQQESAEAPKAVNGANQRPATSQANGRHPAPPPPNQARSSNGEAPSASSDPGHGMPPSTFEEVVELFRAHNKPLLHGWLHGRAKLVHFEPGKIQLEKGDQLLTERRQEMASLLRSWTDEPWQIIESDQEGALSLTDQEAEAKQQRLTELADDPRVKPVLEIFPGAKVIDVQTPAGPPTDNLRDSQEQTMEP